MRKVIRTVLMSGRKAFPTNCQPSLPSPSFLSGVFSLIPLPRKTRLKPRRHRLALSTRSRQKPWLCTRAQSVR